MSDESREIVTVTDLWLKAESAKAMGVLVANEAPIVWLPKSEIENDTLETGKEGTVEIPRWLADEKELNYEDE